MRIWLIVGVLAAAPGQGSLSDAVADRLRARLESAASEPTALQSSGQPLHARGALARFYERRVYRTAWLDAAGSFDRVDQLVDAIRAADRHGLDPADYHLALLETPLAAQGAPRRDRTGDADLDRLVDLELAATDAFLVYGAHLVAGRVDPVSLAPNFPAERTEADLAEVLDAAVAKGEIAAALDSLLPRSPGYRRLQEALAIYRELAARGGWREIAAGPKLEVGASGERVRLLRQRLAVTGDLGVDLESSIFDAPLDGAVRWFQERHGLDVDGVVGPATLAALNVPAEQRVAQIALNLERWRWLPRDLGRRYVLVDVAAFELRVIEDEEAVMTMHAVVGRPYRRTPTFSATMTYLVVSPYWHVPPGIAVRDILPAVKKDLSYLAERGFRVFQGWSADEREIDPGEIDWKSLSAAGFPYRFRQEPGDKNMLGRLKFMFPNRHNVYLHDTPLRELFLPVRRAFSSGCIRIERPFELADYLLRRDPRWTPDAVIAAARLDQETTIRLAEPIVVHIVYWTTWGDDGTTHFREDIYSRDAPLRAALAAPPPGIRRTAASLSTSRSRRSGTRTSRTPSAAAVMRRSAAPPARAESIPLCLVGLGGGATSRRRRAAPAR